MRLFVAVFPDEPALRAWSEFKSSAASWPIRWTSDLSLHFTLKFLGSVKPELEPAIQAALEKISNETPPFSLALKGGGVFPPKGAPSIFWIGAQGEVSPLFELARNVELELKPLGFQPESRPYQPHLTVARLADKNVRMTGEQGREFTAWIQKFSSHPFAVDKLLLMESQLGPSESKYSVRHSFPFHGR